jgi:hypothetical protein
MGAAIAVSASNAITVIALVIACRRTTKLDPSSVTAFRHVTRFNDWLRAGIRRPA